MENRNSFHSRLFERQLLHLTALILLVVAVMAGVHIMPVEEGRLFGISSSGWFILSVAAAVLHQVYTWLMWRAELYGKRLSKLFGRRAFTIFRIGFGLFGLSRFAIIPLAIANQGTLSLPGWLQYGVSVLFFGLSGWLFYSVLRWFGVRRAMGLDHFLPDEAPGWGMVKKGIFRYTSNGMYTAGFLIFWAIALWFESAGALIVAAFAHLYIWVHYFCTETPDMNHIYR
jgi:protein-S-isoprenylcysteine O-methyltransferase Ste14